MSARTGQLVIAIAALMVGVACGYLWGSNRQSHEFYDSVEGLHLEAMANTLTSLRMIEESQIDEAKRLLQAQTNGQLSWIIKAANRGESEDRGEERCKLLNTLKQYRETRGLFRGPEWDYLWKIPEMKAEEDVRVKYLNSLSCGSEVFFTVK